MDVLIVFARAPFRGAAKTRLAPALGLTGAHRLYAAMFADTLALSGGYPADHLLSLAGPALPFDAPPGWTVISQPERTFGERLAWSFSRAYARGAGRCVLIGADAPHMPSARLDEAYAALATHDVAVGPTRDGGYYLLGLRAPSPWIFSDIAWSTAGVFAQTLKLAEAHGCRSRVLPDEFDVDTADEARQLHELLRREPARAPRTARALATLFVEATP